MKFDFYNLSEVSLQMASQPGSNANGEFQGFRLRWATESETSFDELKAEINTFAQTFNLYVHPKIFILELSVIMGVLTSNRPR